MVKSVLKKGIVFSFSFILLIMMVGGVLGADCPSEIYECCEITSSGDYSLLNSLNAILPPSDICIDVSADNVKITCGSDPYMGDHIIDFYTDDAIGIYSNKDGTEITDCEIIMDGGIGIEFDGTNSGEIHNNNIHNSLIGILLDTAEGAVVHNNTLNEHSDSGIYSDDSVVSRIYDNTITSSGNGMFITGSVGEIIEDNTIDSYTNYGIYIEESQMETIENNDITDTVNYDGIYVVDNNPANPVYGIKIKGDIKENKGIVSGSNGRGIHFEDIDYEPSTVSEVSEIDSVLIKENGKEGIKLVESAYILIKENVIATNGEIITEEGISLYMSHHNDLIENIVSGSSGDGISIKGTVLTGDPDSHNNFMFRNTVSDNGGNGIYLFKYQGALLNDGGTNRLTANDLIDNNNHGIYVVESHMIHIEGGRVSGSVTGNGIFVKDSSHIMVEGGKGVYDENYKMKTYGLGENFKQMEINDNKQNGVLFLRATSESSVDGVKIYDNEEDGIKFESSNLSNIGWRITGSGAITKTPNEIYYNGGNGIQILNCDGTKQGESHSWTYPGNTVIFNYVIANSLNGIYVKNSPVQYIGSHPPGMNDDSIVIVPNPFKLAANYVIGNGLGEDGFQRNGIKVDNSDNVEVFVNIVSANKGSGFGVLNSDKVIVEKNYAGVLLDKYKNDISEIGISIPDGKNEGNGFEFDNSDYVRLFDNEARENGYDGFKFYQSNGPYTWENIGKNRKDRDLGNIWNLVNIAGNFAVDNERYGFNFLFSTEHLLAGYSSSMVDLSPSTMKQNKAKGNKKGEVMNDGGYKNYGKIIDDSVKGLILNGSSNNTFFDSNFSNNTLHDVHLFNNSVNNVLINCSYNLSKSNVTAGSELIRKWYYEAYVGSELGWELEEVNFEIYNSSNDLVLNFKTDINGRTSNNFEEHINNSLIEFINNGGTRTYQGNYTINISKQGYENISIVHNVTSEHNINENFTLELDGSLTEGPWSDLISPNQNNISEQGEIEFECYGLNGGSSLTNVTLYIWNSTGNVTYSETKTLTTSGSKTFSYTFTYDDNYYWNCKVYDNSNQFDHAPVDYSLIIDSLAPEIEIGYPINDSNYGYNNFSISYFLNEANPDSCWWTNNSGATNHSLDSCGSVILETNINEEGIMDRIIIGYEGEISNQTWIEGWNNITIYTNDTFGHINSSSVTFFIETEENLSFCRDLYIENQVYSLTQNILTNETICLNILADNITLSCNNYNISADELSILGINLKHYDNFILNDCNLQDFSIGMYIGNSSNNIITDSDLSTNLAYALIIEGNLSHSNEVHNTLYDISKEFVDYGSDLIRYANYQAYVNDSFGNNINNANVTGYNVSGEWQFTMFTDSNGLTEVIEIVDYYAFGNLFNITVDNSNYTITITNRTFYSDYTINVTKGVYNDGHQYDLRLDNVLPDAFMLVVYISVNFVPPTPDDDSSQYEDNIYVNITTSDEDDHYAFTDFDRDVVLWMRMDDINASGDPQDRSSYSNNGTAEGDAVQVEDGKFEEGFSFDGIDDSLDLGSDSSLNIGDNSWTVSFWINARDSTGSWDRAFYMGGSSAENAGYDCEFGTSIWRCYMSDGSSLINAHYGTETNLKGKWQHIVMVLDRTNERILGYLNGSLVSNNSAVGFGTVTSNDFLSIGNNNALSSDFNGTLDEFIILKRALNSNEILALYNASANQYYNNFTDLTIGVHNFTGYAVDIDGRLTQTEERNVEILAPELDISFVPPTPDDDSSQYEDNIYVNMTSSGYYDHYAFTDFDRDVVLWMRMDDINGSGDPWDRSSYSNNGTAMNGAVQNVSGYFGKGFEFGGYMSGDDIRVNNIDFNPGEVTYSIWIRPNDVTKNWDGIFTNSAEADGASPADRINILTASSDGKIYAYNVYGLYIPSTNCFITKDTWSHVVVVVSNSSQSGKMYINGSECGEDTSFNINVTTPGDYNIIGARANLWNWNGTMDDVIIFNRTLDANEILALYNASANQYYNNFTNLEIGTHDFTGYVVDIDGNLNQVGERNVEILAPVFDISIIYPTSDISVTQNQFFNVTVNVSCTLGNCGTINASLDPIPEVGEELTGKRTYNQKVFSLGEGKVRYKIHAGHIHYKDNGGLVDIDTTLVETDSGWAMNKASYSVEIPKYSDDSFEFTNNYKDNQGDVVSMKPVVVNNVGGVLDEDNSVVYSDAFGSGIDLKVRVGNNGFDKLIVINEKPKDLESDLEFKYEIEIDGFDVKSDSGLWNKADSVQTSDSIVLDKTGETFFREFRVWDSSGKSFKINVKLEKIDGKYYLIKILDKELLENAVYPVVTDDTVSYYAGAGDGYVYSGNSNWDVCHDATTGLNYDYTSSWVITMDYYGGSPTYQIYRSFVPIDTSGIDDSAVIENATLNLDEAFMINDPSDCALHLVQTHQASSSSLTYGDFDEVESTEGAPSVNFTDITSNYNEFNLNSTGRSWINKSGITYLGIRDYYDFNDIPPSDGYCYFAFQGSETSGTNKDPYLEVDSYIVGKGVIPFTIGATPFYTNESNPRMTSSLSQGASETIVYWVNATGSLGTYEFFSFANLTSDLSIGEMSDLWYVDIV
ncbi:hypothetical protein GOV12_03200 [Candidatus Pacearchaeota archaeon]|nr:hypothetical protein [Candidatus Pacearchaeota archaeon]